MPLYRQADSSYPRNPLTDKQLHHRQLRKKWPESLHPELSILSDLLWPCPIFYRFSILFPLTRCCRQFQCFLYQPTPNEDSWQCRFLKLSGLKYPFYKVILKFGLSIPVSVSSTDTLVVSLPASTNN